MKQLEELDQYPQNGSGWRLNAILGSDLEMDKYKPLRGSSYIELPKPIRDKKATINIQNKKDNECFKWSVLAALHNKEIDRNHERVNKYKQWEDDLNFDNIKFPVAIKDIKKFEKQNNLKINVFGLDDKLNVYVIKNTCDDNAIDLLFISNDETNHYCWIKNFNKLLSMQISKHDGFKFICKRCLNPFRLESAYNKHRELCNLNDEVRVDMPLPNTHIKFKNQNRSMRVPFVIYADFECITTKIESQTKQKKEDESYTEKYQHHQPSGYCLNIVCNNKSIKKITYRGQDCVEHFVTTVEKLGNKIYNKYLKPVKPLKMTEEDWIKYNSDTCHICKNEIEYKRVCCNGKSTHKQCAIKIDKETSDIDWKEYYKQTNCYVCDKPIDNPKVRDHCHITGKFRGPAHNSCNINYKVPKFIPIIFHNLEGYDSHLFIKQLEKVKEK